MKHNFNRYWINTNKISNQITPHIMKSKTMLCFIQSLLLPVQRLADKFKKDSIERAIEANMTSQTMYFEWFLNRKFRDYMDDGQIISLENTNKTGVPIFSESEIGKSVMVAYNDDESGSDDRKAIRDTYEETQKFKTSFIVFVPAVTKINQEEFNNMVSYYVNKYRVVGKTFNIIVK